MQSGTTCVGMWTCGSHLRLLVLFWILLLSNVDDSSYCGAEWGQQKQHLGDSRVEDYSCKMGYAPDILYIWLRKQALLKPWRVLGVIAVVVVVVIAAVHCGRGMHQLV